MSEIELNELGNELEKEFDIRPKSDIDMADADAFWKEVFGSEIKIDENVIKYSEKFSELRKDAKISNFNSVKEFWKDTFSKMIDTKSEEDVIENSQEGLTQEEKDIIKKETGWSDEIIDAIHSMDEYKIYKEAGLVEGEVNGKKCLMRTDIDWDQKDQFGYTNRERVAEGYAPLDKNGSPIQLHHIGQHADSPLAELTFKEHRTGGNDKILHDKTKETEVHGEGNNWDSERKEYWENRQTDGGDM